MEFWNSQLQQFNLELITEYFEELHAIRVGAKNYGNYYFSPINDFVFAYECHFANRQVIHSFNDIYSTAGKHEETQYAYWLHKRDFINWSIQNRDEQIYLSVEKSHLSTTIDMSASALFRLRKNEEAYILLWIYLIATQLKNRFDYSIIKNCPQSIKIIMCINILINQITPYVSFSGIDIPINKKNRWIMPSGVLYNNSELASLNIDENKIIDLIFSEIMSIKANYQMCYCIIREYDIN